MLINIKLKIKNYSLGEKIVIFLAILSATYALYISVKYAGQAPLDLYSFRQTQTALTAFWLVKNGFSLAYETPVAGPPWSIPFEFPIYQYIVALASEITKCSLDATGRMVSFLFLALCLVPVRAITRQLKLSPSVFYIFAALLFSSPLYLYWGRTFMIETTAIFFSIAAIKYFIDIVQTKYSFRYSSLFLIFIVLSILQKATTGLPVLAILGLVYFFLSIKDLTSSFEEKNSSNGVFLIKKIILALVYFGIPLAMGVIWTLYTDHIKALNGLGVNLTSGALGGWNWGSLDQRLSAELYVGVIWKRLFEQNLSGVLGVVILLFALFSNSKKSVKWVILISASMGLVPLFSFTNLHLVHTYYQTANLIFLVYAVAVSMGHVLNGYFEKKVIIVLLTTTMVVSNYFWFSKDYLNVIKTEFNRENSRDFAVSDILRREIPQEKYFVAFGNDWSSSLAYLSERKSFTVPVFFKQYEKISLNPENFINEAHLGGVVVCPSGGRPTLDDLTQWSSKNRSWKIGAVHNCHIAIPESFKVNTSTKTSYVDCQGSLDYVSEKASEKHNILSISGWTSIAGEPVIFPEKIYVTMTKQSNAPIFFEALEVNRPNNNIVFSRIINTSSLSGEYVISVAKLNQGHLESCKFQKKISINGG